ncbi:MAG: hypothetical protein ACPH5M_01035, partial [Candidatus Puniceispirillaceae bacterium]
DQHPTKPTPSKPKAPNANLVDPKLTDPRATGEKYQTYFGSVSLEITLLMTTVGAGICQFDNTTSPATESPASVKNINEIRVMSFPYPLSHFGPLILASVFSHACSGPCPISRF